MSGTSAARILGASALVAGLACASARPSSPEGRPCVGLTPPRILTVGAVEVPASFTAARLSVQVPTELTVGGDGAIREAAARSPEVAVFAPFAEETLKRARVDGGSFEGHPAAVRVPVRVALGLMRERDEKKAPAELWAYVAPGQSREARWQLRDSVSRLSVFAHVPALPPAGGAIVAVDPRGQTRTLVVLSASDARQDLRQTVSTGKFFAGAGEYRLELRAPGTLAASRLTIADDYRQAVINACEPLSVSRKTGPGN